MDFIDHIRELSARIPKQLPHIQTEEATKNALVMPFISALGYGMHNDHRHMEDTRSYNINLSVCRSRCG
jgi:hypothetical protein